MSTHLPNWLHTELSQHWKNGRPDKRITSDAVYFIDLGKELFTSLQTAGLQHFSAKVSDKEIVELAYVIAAWFEDFISEAGIWKTFQDRNQEVSGVPLPFLDLEGYDPDYINWQDINFIIWLWMRKLNSGKFVFPSLHVLRDLAEEIVMMLEESIDEAPATTVYDEFFTISSAHDFFDIRVRFAWLSQSCYLYGTLDMQPHIVEMLVEQAKMMEDEGITLDGNMVNDSVIAISFNSKFRLGDWRVNEIAAQLFHTDENTRQQLRAMSEKYQDEFFLEAIGDTHYTLRPIEFDIKLQVLRRSGDIHLRDGRYVVCSLVKYADEYWINGTISQGQWREGQDLLENSDSMLPKIYRPKIQQDNYSEALEIQEQVFTQQFGGRLHIAPDANAAEQALDAFISEVDQRLSDRFGDGKAGLSFPPVALPSHLNRKQPIGFVYIPQKAIFLSNELPIVIDFLEGKSAIGEAKTVFFTLFCSFPASVSLCLAQLFPMDRIAWNGTAGWDIRANAAALAWYFGKNE